MLKFVRWYIRGTKVAQGLFYLVIVTYSRMTPVFDIYFIFAQNIVRTASKGYPQFMF